jgi:tRNA nucleotidyltransferase (CCA-adding enzyme)
MFEDVLERIRPSEAEKKKNKILAEELIEKIKSQGYEAVVVGSRARDTFISGDRDLDIFVFFPSDTTRAELEQKGVALGKRILKGHNPTLHYAEHPYVKGVVDGIEVEIVPCYRMRDKVVSAVDRSPLHNIYVKENLKEGQRDEVLLLKQFMKAAGCYGANQRVRGFSGYLCELLILNHESFMGLVKAASEWRPQVKIDIKRARREYSKFSEPLIVIDPTDMNRNAGAAVSSGTMARFVLACRDFLAALKKKSYKRFFFPEPKKLDMRKAKGRNWLAVTFAYPKTVEEIAWSQIEKFCGDVIHQLERSDFRTLLAAYWTDEKKDAVILFELENFELPEKKKQFGPPVWDEKNAKAFTDKHREWWVEGEKLATMRKREFTNAVDLVKKIMRKREAPSHIRPTLSKAKVLVGDAALKSAAVVEALTESIS